MGHTLPEGIRCKQLLKLYMSFQYIFIISSIDLYPKFCNETKRKHISLNKIIWQVHRWYFSYSNVVDHFIVRRCERRRIRMIWTAPMVDRLAWWSPHNKLPSSKQPTHSSDGSLAIPTTLAFFIWKQKRYSKQWMVRAVPCHAVPMSRLGVQSSVIIRTHRTSSSYKLIPAHNLCALENLFDR